MRDNVFSTVNFHKGCPWLALKGPRLMASTILLITLDEALASRLTAAAKAQGVDSEVLAAACVEQHLDTALRHMVLLQRQEIVDRQIGEIAAFIEEASAGGGLDPVDLFRICRYPRDDT